MGAQVSDIGALREWVRDGQALTFFFEPPTKTRSLQVSWREMF
jgi:hypothetical protein